MAISICPGWFPSDLSLYGFGDPEKEPTFVLFDKGYAIGFVCLSAPVDDEYRRKVEMPDRLGHGYKVSSVEIDRNYKGNGLAGKMYLWLLRNFCNYIMADTTQTTGGVAIWRKMLNSRQFSVLVFDWDRYLVRKRRSGKDFSQVYNVRHLYPIVTLPDRVEAMLDNN